MRVVVGAIGTALVASVMGGCATVDEARGPRVPGEWNVVEAGAVGDGVMDNTAVFQRLLDEAGQAGGGVVKVPAGRYRIDGTLAIPSGVTLQGTFRVAPTDMKKPAEHLDGSVLLAYAGRGRPDAEPFILLGGQMATVDGLIVYYPECAQTEAEPVPYPPCVSTGRKRQIAVGVLNCLFVNPYEAIRLGNAPRHLVRNVTGYPIWRGLFVDRCTDIGRVENVHFWPFGRKYNPEDPFCKWINTKGVAFEFSRTDWQYVTNTFCFGYGVGYKFSQSEMGACNGNFLGIGADSCQRAVLVEQTKPNGLLVTNGEFVGRWSSTDSVTLEIAEGASGHVGLVNCAFWGPIERCVWQRSPAIDLTASACNFVDWDKQGRGFPAVQIDGGKANLQGNTFQEGGALHLRVAEPARSVIVMGNQAAGGFRLESEAGDRVQLIGNERDPVVWTDEAKGHYRVNVGYEGDDRYTRDWHARQRGAKSVDPAATYRWSMSESTLALPVRPGVPSVVELKAHVSAAAQSPEAGIYLNDRRLAAFVEGDQTARVALPPGRDETVTLRIRCEGWVPAKTTKGSRDQRVLGIRLYSVVVRADGAGDRVFDANTGQW